MALRSLRERAIQTLAFEAGGLALAAPLYWLVFGGEARESVALVAAVSIAVMTWTPIHNTAFDWLEWRLARRLASDRPTRLRAVHAFTHEATAMVVSLPVIVSLGGHGWVEAVAVDLGLTLFYAGYAYVFHLAYDRCRPVVFQEAVGGRASAPGDDAPLHVEHDSQ